VKENANNFFLPIFVPLGAPYLQYNTVNMYYIVCLRLWVSDKKSRQVKTSLTIFVWIYLIKNTFKMQLIKLKFLKRKLLVVSYICH